MEEIRDPQAVLDALERAKADAKRYREEAESLTQQLADQRSEFEAQLKTANDTTLELQSKVKRSMVESAVRNAKGNERVMRFIDLDSINVEDDNLVGFDAALEKVKVDLPELFDDKKRAGSADMFASGTPQELSGSQRQVAKIFNQ